MRVKFYCLPSLRQTDGKSPIQVSISHKGRAKIHTQERCVPEEFEALLNSKTPNPVKAFCNNIENRLQQIYSNLLLNNEPISADILKDIYLNGSRTKTYTLQDMFNNGLRVKAKEDVEPTTFRKYEIVIDRFYELTGYTQTTEASRVKHSDILTFQGQMQKAYSDTHAKKTMKILKYFFALAVQDGKLQANPFGLLKIGQGTPKKEVKYLTQEEIKIIRNARIVSDRIDKVRDLFLFQCYSGLAYIDIANLQPSDVQSNDEGQYYIKKNRYKTNVQYTSVLFKDAINIWEFYDGELPIISNQKYNSYLKELDEISGLKRGLTSHMGRHSYACYCINELGIDFPTLAKMLGHTTTQMTEIYGKVFDSTVFSKTKQTTTEKSTLSYLSPKERLKTILGF